MKVPYHQAGGVGGEPHYDPLHHNYPGHHHGHHGQQGQGWNDKFQDDLNFRVANSDLALGKTHSYRS